MAFDRITQDEISQNGVVSAPDKLTGTAADNKAIFDKLIKNIVAREFNKLLDDLEAATGAASIGAAPFDGVEGKNIQDQLKNVQSNVSTSFDGTTINGHKIPGTVVITKGDVGLGNVDNTSDMEKPVSSPQRSYVESVARDFILGQLPVPLPITQGGTNADTPQEALANLGAGVRPNLGDNCDFTAPINQRGVTSWSIPSGDVPIFDRWKIQATEGGVEAGLESGGLKLSMTAANQGIKQEHVAGSLLPRKVYTSSVMVDGKLYSAEIVPEEGTGMVAQYPGTEFHCAITFSAGQCQWYPYIDYRFTSRTVTIARCKLENDRGQTLGCQTFDTLKILDQPDSKPSQMLTECQRYLFKVGMNNAWGYADSPSVAYLFVPTPVTMRSEPVWSGRISKLYPFDGNSVTNVIVWSLSDGIVCLQVQGTGFTTGKVYSVSEITDGFLSAEL